jgi:alpha-tubulin suppressor-like RCC1 family protein
MRIYPAGYAVRLATMTIPVLLLGCGDNPSSPTEPENAPPLQATAAAALVFSQVDAGTLHSCALTGAGKAWCWGSGASGELGNGKSSSSLRPVAVGGGLTFIEIRGGTSFSCGLASDDKASCWGSNQFGQLGDGTSALFHNTPVRVAGSRRFRQIHPGLNHTCAITFDDVAFCWGQNDTGELGDGTTADRNVPVQVHGGIRLKQVRAGGGQSCGLTGAGKAYCWGLNNVGQLGDGTTMRRLTPVAVAGSHVFTKLTVGDASACALAQDQRGWCWGHNALGQLADGSTATRRVRPVLIADNRQFTGIAEGGDHGCGILTSGATYCWGRTYSGAVGDGSPLRTSTVIRVPVPVVNGAGFKVINSGPQHTCALNGAGHAYCWGWNAGGQLGDGTTHDRSVPVAVLGP